MVKLTKLAVAGVLALSLAACHNDSHEFCDWDDDGETDVGCILLIKAVGVTAATVAMRSSEEPRPG